MFKRFKNLKWTTLLIHIIVTIAYPAVKAFTSENKLLVFSDILAIVGLILLAAGVVYSLILHGDFDVASYSLMRGIRSGLVPNYEDYRKERKEKREESFNYPLFLSIVYLAVSAFIAYVLL